MCAPAIHSGEAGDYDGPTLKGVFGRKAGSLEDYRYSAAMKRSAVTWDAMTLDSTSPIRRRSFPGIGWRLRESPTKPSATI